MRKLIVAVLCSLLLSQGAHAQSINSHAEQIRSKLSQALLLFDQSEQAAAQLAAVEAHYQQLAAQLEAAPQAKQRLEQGLTQAQQAVDQHNKTQFILARHQIWLALLDAAFVQGQAAVQRGDLAAAEQWLNIREYPRRAAEPTRPYGTQSALAGLRAGTLERDQALLLIRRDLLETYQSRLNEVLQAAKHNQGKQVELAVQAQGYAQILLSSYQQQRGEAAAQTLEQVLAELQTQAQDAELWQVLEDLLADFRAAPLDEREQAARAAQLLRFIALVPLEYERGVQGSQVIYDFELREARVFFESAQSTFGELAPTLHARDAQASAQLSQQLNELERLLAFTAWDQASEPKQVRQQAEQIEQILREIMPSAWLKRSSASDFVQIRMALDLMEQALVQGDYQQAELARLDAYAILESGPEARILAFAPQLKLDLEQQFWYGSAQAAGLARLIEQQADPATITQQRQKLDLLLAEAQRIVQGNTAPLAVATNAGIIVFREGLEAVLILASLLASLVGARQIYRKPIWIGAALAFVATIITGVLMYQMLALLARYGQVLEAIVSLVAIAVLLLITNWFFHQMYWTDWLASFHAQKRRLLGVGIGQSLGLVLLGFTSIYREGFETTLFLQALLLDAGVSVVLGGAVVGLLCVLVIGLGLFQLQAHLPYKRMLIVTGVMIGAVLLMMVGQTVQLLQVLGWLPLHPITQLPLPYWLGLWFGVYASWEGVLLQGLAAVFVIGSYLLAERQKRKGQHQPITKLPTV